MSKNDMEVIMYQILKYLYECMKVGRAPDVKEYGWASKLFQIPKGYWCSVMDELIGMGLIKGAAIKKTKESVVISGTDSASITYKGREFLRENSGMHKAREVVGEAFEMLLSTVIGVVT